MEKLLRSSNDAHRQRGVDLATHLGSAALDTLHELMGHGRREVRNAAALALGEIGDSSSLGFLIGGLYGTTTSVTRFRPSADTAAEAIARFPLAKRLEAAGEIAHPVRPAQLLQILRQAPARDAYAMVLSLAKRNLILVDWSESDLDVLIGLDEDRAWPDVVALVKRRDHFKIRHVLPQLSPDHQLELVRMWLAGGINDAWYFRHLLDAVEQVNMSAAERREHLSALHTKIEGYRGGFKERDDLLARLAESIRGLGAV
jgi:hypothetical protein